jgi:hypothetical protein
MDASFSNCRRLSRFLLSVCLTAAFFLAADGHCQTAGTGSIQGAVSDATGAVIQNAAVILTDTATQIQHSVKSGADGLYSFPNIPIGVYTLDVAASGFEHYSQAGIVLEVGSSININVAMTVGQAAQRVEVRANGIALQTEDPSFKQTIDEKTLTELPLNGRQVTSLITLSGGSASAPANDMQGSKTFYSSVVVSVAGGMGNATDYRLDGGDHNDYMTNVNLPFPFPDAVNQFSVETSALGAQSGLHPGGLVNVVTRSGSNQWHGTAFEFIRNNFIDATNFFSTTKDTLHQNQYGGTFGGRIITDKLFFFGGYQRLKADQSQSLTQAFVPTPANLLGDFSVTDGAACQASGKAIQLLNPQTGAPLPNDQISPSYFSAPSIALEKYMPATTDPCGLVFYSIPSQQVENEFIGRVDWTINQKHSLYGRYFLDGYTSPAFFSPTNVLITTQPGNIERAQSLTLGETYIINSHFVNSFHATGSRRRDDRGAASQGIGPSTIGIDSYAPLDNFLELTVTNKFSTYCGTCAQAAFNVNTFSFTDDVNMLLGKHQLAFGGEYVRSQLNINNLYESNGTFTMSGVYSQKGPAGTSKGGTGADANLDFLTGALNAYQQSKAQQNALRAPIPSLYVQDIFHATKRLVLSAGVRWDPQFAPVDKFRRGSIFNMNDFLSDTHSTVFPNAPAGSLYYGDAGVPAGFTQNSPWQFSPRVGITFDPTGQGKTVLRAGSALVYDEPNFFTAQRVNQNPPFATAISNVPGNVALNFASPWSNGSTPSNPFPLPFKPPASTTFGNQAQFIVLPAHFHPTYTFQWTASLQQELRHGWQFQIDYIGSQSSFVALGLPLDPAVYIPGSSTLGNTSSRYLLTLDNPAQGKKYAGGGSGSILISDGANASYNGMIATIQHRVSNDFSLFSNYTWSHCFDIEDAQGDFAGTTVQNPNDIRGDRANCGFDHRAIFNAALVAESHFFLNGWKSLALNNWELAPLLQIHDGVPFTVISGIDNSLTATGNDRPNLVNPNGIYTHKTLTKTNAGNRNFINASAFAQNATGTFGDVGRNSLRGPKYVQLDAQLSRYFPLGERFKLDFRLEAFNALNHPDFNPPTSSSTSSTASLLSSSFGQVTSTVTGYGARVFQGGLKLIF